MYIEQGYRGQHKGVYYILGGVLIFFGWQILGAIPLLATIVLKTESLVDISTDMTAMSETLGKNLLLFLILFSFLIAMASLWVAVKFIHKQSWLSFTTSRKSIDWKRVAFAFTLWGLVLIAITFLGIYLEPEHYEFQFEPIPFLTLCLIALIFLPIQTSFEEYFTRGYLMQGIGIAIKNRWLPFVVSSTLFGFLHIFNPEVEKLGYLIMVYYVGTGFFLGILTLMDEGLELPLGFHAANNLIAALLVSADWTAFSTHSLYKDISEPVLGWDVLLPVLVIYPILILIFAKKYNWNNWNQKLFGRVMAKEEFEALENTDTPTV